MKNRTSIPELSSIRSQLTEKLNTQADLDLEDVDYDKITFQQYYNTLNTQTSQLLQIDGELLIKDIIKRLLQNVNKKISENQIIQQIPIHTYQLSLIRIQHPIQQYFRTHEIPSYDSFNEDKEPPKFQQEQWLVSKVNLIPSKPPIELDQQSTTSNRQSLTAQTFVRSRVLIQVQSNNPIVFQDQANLKSVKEKEKLPGIVDLNDPLDISITEDQLRAQKERDYKIKQELREQERRRKQKELEEQQLKYELITKDKKSKSYTYDYDGKLISVNLMKNHKFPPSTATLGSKFEDGQTKINAFHKRKTFFQSSSQIKKKLDEEQIKDPVNSIKFQQIAPLVNENMPLQQGVLLIQEGRVREGPKEQPIDLEKMLDPQLRMIRNEYLSLTQQINASHNQSQTQLVKAEDVNVKEFGNEQDKKQILNRIRRLSQPNLTHDGNIKINSLQIYEQVAQIAFDDKDQANIIPPIPPIKPTEQKVQRSPIDQYNISLYKNAAWGKEVSTTSGPTIKLKGNKARVKDILSTVGIVVKRTRERRGVSETALLPKMKNIF